MAVRGTPEKLPQENVLSEHRDLLFIDVVN